MEMQMLMVDDDDPFPREAEAAMLSGEPYPRGGDEYDYIYEERSLEEG